MEYFNLVLNITDLPRYDKGTTRYAPTVKLLNRYFYTKNNMKCRKTCRARDIQHGWEKVELKLKIVIQTSFNYQKLENTVL